MATPPSPRSPFQETAPSTRFPNKAAVMTYGSIMLAVAALFALITVGILHSTHLPPPSNRSHPSTPPLALPSPTLGDLSLGSNAPDFTLSTLAGDHTVSLSASYGKPILLNFWSLDCSDCVKETSIIQTYYATQRARGKDLVVLGINLDKTDTFVHVAQFQEHQGLTYPILVDDHSQARTRYHVTSTPTSFFIDIVNTNAKK